MSLARVALEAFSGTAVPSLEHTLGACAGVAIVKSHAPFARAYELADALCREAKARLRQGHGRFRSERCAIDWHVGHLATLEPLARTREREYRANGWDLTLRPYPQGRSGATQTFSWLLDDVLGDGGAGGFRGAAWQRHRNKIKDLREILRSGPEAVQQSLDAWKVTAGPEAGALPAGLGNGFQGSETPLLDAIELMDLHLPLEEAEAH